MEVRVPQTEPQDTGWHSFVDADGCGDHDDDEEEEDDHDDIKDDDEEEDGHEIDHEDAVQLLHHWKREWLFIVINCKILWSSTAIGYNWFMIINYSAKAIHDHRLGGGMALLSLSFLSCLCSAVSCFTHKGNKGHLCRG